MLARPARPMRNEVGGHRPKVFRTVHRQPSWFPVTWHAQCWCSQYVTDSWEDAVRQGLAHFIYESNRDSLWSEAEIKQRLSGSVGWTRRGRRVRTDPGPG